MKALLLFAALISACNFPSAAQKKASSKLSHNTSFHKVAKNLYPQNAKKVFVQRKKESPLTLTEAIKEIRNCVVKIKVTGNLKGPDGTAVKNADGTLLVIGGTGSGFFLNDSGYVVTNYHVVRIPSDPNVLNGRVQISIGASGEMGDNYFYANFMDIDCESAFVDKEKDLAILKPVTNPLKGPAIFGYGEQKLGLAKVPRFLNENLEEGTKIAASGYPLAYPTLITNSGFIASSNPADGKYEADMQINPGNSGGPIYLVETGEIIGVAVSHGVNATLIRIKADDGSYHDVTPADSVFLFRIVKGKPDAIPMDRLSFLYNSGISQVISFKEVIKVAERFKIPVVYKPVEKPKKVVANKRLSNNTAQNK